MRTRNDGSVEANLTVSIEADRQYTLVLAVQSSLDPPVPVSTTSGTRVGTDTSIDVLGSAVRLARRSSTTEGLLALRTSHAHWWESYWNASSVDLGPERRVLESFWFGMQYMGGSANQAGKQAAGQWGNWIQTDDMNWNG